MASFGCKNDIFQTALMGWIAEENRWTCVPEANANPEERVYASGTLRAPMVTPQDVGAGFTKQLDLFLTININFLNQLLPR